MGTYYFAYGINLNKRLMRERCPEATPRLTVTLPNYRLAFAGWSRQWRGGAGTVRPLHGEKVRGGLWELTDADWRRLDRFEGYPQDYTKVNVMVFDENGAAYEAVTYVKAGQAPENPPSKEYLGAIGEGYRDWGIV